MSVALASTAPHPWERRLTFFLCLFFAAVATLFATSARHEVNPDGAAYLDLADHYAHGRFAEAANAYWSPLYPMLLGAMKAALRPAPGRLLPLVHAMNVVLAAGALAAMAWLLRGCRALFPALVGPGGAGAPALLALGYAAAIWALLALGGVGMVTPDILVTGLVYLATAQLVLIRTCGATPRRAVVLGLVLGLAYLAKAAMLPIGLAYLLVLPFAVRRGATWRAPIVTTLLAALAWGAIAAPQIASVSREAGHASFGESSKIVYAWFVNGVPYDSLWRGADTSLGTPVHRAPLLLDAPRVYAIDAGVGGTYPVWYRPTHWAEGWQVRRSPGTQLALAWDHTRLYLTLLLPLVTASIVMLVYAGARGRALLHAARAHAFVLIPSLAGLALYALILVEGRYIAGFASVLVLFVPAIVACTARESPDRLFAAGAAALSVVLLVGTAAPVPATLRAVVQSFGPAARGSEPGAIRASLACAGVGVGTPVAIAGPATPHLPWAVVAGVRIVAQVDEPRLLDAEHATVSAVRRAAAAAGAVAVVAREDAPLRAGSGWRRLGTSRFHLLPVDVAGPGSPAAAGCSASSLAQR